MECKIGRNPLVVMWDDSLKRLVAYTPNGARWADGSLDRQFGTEHFTLAQIVTHKVNNQPMKVQREIPNPENKSGFSVVTDPAATAAAQFQADQIEREFEAWAKGSKHALELENIYNERFNSSIERKWKTPNVERFPGASPLITLMPHQRRAVYRASVRAT